MLFVARSRATAPDHTSPLFENDEKRRVNELQGMTSTLKKKTISRAQRAILYDSLVICPEPKYELHTKAPREGRPGLNSFRDRAAPESTWHSRLLLRPELL